MTIPFNVLVISKLATGNRKMSIPSGPFYPEKGIEPILDEISPKLILKIPDWKHQGQDKFEITATLRFHNLKSFRPRGVARQIQELAPIIGLIKTLKDIRAGRTRKEVLAPHIEKITGKALSASGFEAGHAGRKAGSPSHQSPKEQALSGLFDLVDTGGGGQENQPGQHMGYDLADLLDQAENFIYRTGAAGTGDYLNSLAQAAQDALDQVLEGIYGDTRFRELEISWMGLKFLMDHTLKSTDVRFYCLSASGDEAVAQAEELAKREWAVRKAHAPSLIVWDQNFDASHPSLSILRKIAELAHDCMIPVITSVDLALFQVKDWREFQHLPYLPSRLSEPGYGAWQTLCASDTTRWLALGFNPMLLRPLYNRDYVRDKFLFNQHPGQALWGRPIWGLAALTILGFTASGWPYLPTGPGGIVLEDLPIMHGTDGPMPLKYAIPEKRAVELHDCGLAPLICSPGEDRAWAFADPVLHGCLNRSDPVIRSQCTLTYQLFVTRFLGLMAAAKKILPSDINDRELAPLLEEIIKSWTGSRKVRVEIQTGSEGRIISITADEIPHLPGPAGLSIQIPMFG